MKMRSPMLAACALALLAPLATLAAQETKPAADEAKPKKAAAAEQCPVRTGSRVRSSKASKADKAFGCMQSAYALRVYTADDLQSTGELNIADALRKLDPSFY